MMKWIKPISIIIVITALWLCWDTVAWAQFDGSVPVVKVLSCNTTDLTHPAFFLTDENNETSWQLKSGATEGWVEIELGETSLIYGLTLAGEMADGSQLIMEYRQNGQWIPFVAPVLRNIPSDGIVDLSYDRAVTDQIRCRLMGITASDCNLSELKVLGRSIRDTYQKIRTTIITSTHSSSDSPPELLTDGNTYTRWVTTHFSTQGEVTFKFGKAYSLANINLYFTAAAKGEFKLAAFVGERWVDLGPVRAKEPGWWRLNLNSLSIVTDKIRLKVTGFGVLGGIGEVEFWGTGDGKGDLRQPICAPNPQKLTENINTYFQIENPGDRLLEIVCQDTLESPLTIELNGATLQVNPTFSLRGQTVYIYPIKMERLQKGGNYLRIHTTATSVTLLGVRLVQTFHDEEYQQPMEDTSDGLLLSGGVNESTISILQSRLALLERVEIFTSPESTVTVSAKVAGVWINLSQIIGENGQFVFSGLGSLDVEELRINNPNNVIIHEARIFGSTITDQAPTVRIIQPVKSMLVDSCRTSMVSVRGFVDNLDAEIKINGETVVLDGHYFTYPIKVFGLKLWEKLTCSVVAVDSLKRKGEDSFDILIADPKGISLDQDDRTYYTDRDVFVISGSMQLPFSKAFVNEQPITVGNNGCFKIDCPLMEGLNIVKITVVFSYGDKLFTWTASRQVVKYTKKVLLTIDTPLPNTATNKPSIMIGGTVQGLGNVQVIVGNTPAVVQGLFYTAEVSLKNGDNPIIVTATDERGQCVQQSIIVTLNQTGVSISQVNPEDGSVLNNGTVMITAKINKVGAVWVDINGKAAQEGAEGLFHLTLSMTDGVHEIVIRALDEAGNTATRPITITTDTQPPLPFEIISDQSGWTNNNRPNISFSTTDVTSGIDHYELSIDDGAYQTVASPCCLPPQTDGEHIIRIKAVDKAGWVTVGTTKIQIDTTPPVSPPNFRTVPGNGRIILRWDAPADDVANYKIERVGKSADASLLTFEVQGGCTEFVDNSTINGDEYRYRITAIDHVSNSSPSSEWIEAMAGLAEAIYQPDKGTAVEYEGVVLLLPKEENESNVGKIVITEIKSDHMENKAIYPTVGPIYDFIAVKSDGTPYESKTFEQNYIGRIQYDLTKVPKGFPENNLGVYYYDPSFDRWFLVPTSAVDKEHHTIYFVTNHFSSFSVQATVIQDLSPQELKDSGYSPLRSYSEYNGISVSPQGGTMSTSVTELVLPGRNNFNLTLKRRYDTAIARNDAFSLAVNGHMAFNLRPDEYVSGGLSFYQVEESINIWQEAGRQLEENVENILEQYLFNQGDYAYSMGQGWRLNLPYVKASNSSMILVLPDGAMHALSEMDKVADGGILSPIFTIDQNGNETINPLQVRKVTFKQSEGDDFTVSVLEVNAGYDITAVAMEAIIKRFDHNNNPFNKNARWYALQYEVTMKDGTVYILDALGRTTKIIDPTGHNSIKICYSGLKLNKIIDSMGRIVRFEYTHPENPLHNYINKISVENDPYHRAIHYQVDEDGLLRSTTDVGGRNSYYQYESRILYGGEVGLKINIVEMILKWIFPEFYVFDSLLGRSDLELYGRLQVELIYPMIQATAPGQGTVHISYEQKTITYGTHKIHRLFGIPISISFSLNLEQRILADKVDVYRDVDLKQNIKSTRFIYDLHYYSDGQPFIRKTTEDDGNRKTVYYFTAVERERYQWIDTSLSDDPWLSADHIPQYTSQISFPVQVSETAILPIQTGLEIYDAKSDKLLERQESTYDIDTMRPLSLTTWHGANYSKLSYTYDNWGNITSVIHQSESNSRVNETRSWIYYYGTSSMLTEDMKAVASPYEQNIINEQMPLVEGSSGPSRRDLVLYKITLNCAPKEISGLNDQLLRTSYQYNHFGQMVGEAQWDGVKWTVSKYKYESPYGSLTEKVDPNGHVTNYTYDSAGFPKAVIERSIHDANNETSDIVISFGYDAATGWKVWQKNPRGYVTQYQYDVLGRTIAIITPDDNDDPSWIPNGDSPDFQIHNPVTSIQYNDVELNSLVTDPLGHETLYDFDELGRLVVIIKYKKENGENKEYAVTRLRYDPWGNIVSITDPNLHTTEYEYDGLGRNTAIVYPKADYETQNPRREMTFDDQRNLLTVTDELGNITTIYRDMQGRTLSQVQQDGFTVVKTDRYYDGLGNEVATVDPRGSLIVNSYDCRNLLIRTDLPEENFWELERLIKAKPYRRFGYDNAGRKTSEIFNMPGGGELETTFTLDELGRIITTSVPYTDKGQAKTAVTKIFYDSNGNKIKIIDANNTPVAPELQRYVSYTYSTADQVLTETDPAGNRTSYTYDELGNLVSMTDPRGNSGKYQGDFTIVYEYDELNRLVAGYLPSQPGKKEKPFVKLVYDTRGNLVRRIEPDGGETFLLYTPRNKVWKESITGKDGIVYTTEHHYDLAGNEDWIKDPCGNKITKEYDTFNRPVTIRREENPDEFESFSYDLNGNRIGYTNGRRNLTKYDYNRYNQLVATENTVQGQPVSTAYRYDRLGNLTWTEDGLKHSSTFTYDELNRLISEANSLGDTKKYQYDAVGNRIWSQDPNGTEAVYTYYSNYLVQAITLTDQSGTKTQSLSYRYDEAGYRKWANCDGVITSYNTITGVYTPDPYGRIYRETKSVNGKTFSVGYDYDGMGRMTAISYPTGRTAEYRYNDMGQLIGVPGYIDECPIYNNGGLLKNVKAVNGVVTSYEYDKNNRLKSLSYSNQGGELKAYTYRYDGANNIIERTKSGYAGNETFTYDELNQLIFADLRGAFEKDPSDERQKVGQVRDDQLGKKPLQMVPSGQLEIPVEQLEVIQLDYAAGSIGVDLQDNVRLSRVLLSPNSSIHRVKQNKLSIYVSPDNVNYAKVTHWKLSLLKNGGMEIVFESPVEARYLKVHCTYDERDKKFIAVQKRAASFANTPDRLIKVYYFVQSRMEWYQYDDAGNRTKETIAQGNSVTRSYSYYENSNRLKEDCRYTYEYDHNGNLIKKTGLVGDPVVWAYEYDLMNRLVRVAKNGEIIAEYIYDDGGFRIAKTKPGGTTSYYIFDLDGNIIYEQEDKDYSEYIYVFGKHFARVDGTTDTMETTKYFYQTDHLGSTIMVTDKDGKQVWSGEYTPFGTVNSKEGELKKAAKFTGKDLDEDTGLYYFNARWYDQDTGRFVSEDSQFNLEKNPYLYAYCSNSPLNRLDPSGEIDSSSNIGTDQKNAEVEMAKDWLRNNPNLDQSIQNPKKAEKTFSTINFLMENGIPVNFYCSYVNGEWYVFSGVNTNPDLYDERELNGLIFVTYVNRNNGSVYRLVNSKVVKDFEGFIEECKAEGIEIVLNDCFRPSGKQEHFYNIYIAWRKNPKSAGGIDAERHGVIKGANPSGKGFHEAGLAFDINWKQLTPEQQKRVIEIAKKYGYFQTVRSTKPGKDEPWHFGWCGHAPPEDLQLSDGNPRLRPYVAELLGYASWNAMVKEMQNDYKGLGLPIYECPYKK